MELAASAQEWLEEGPDVVDLNGIHPDVAEKLVKELRRKDVDVEIATRESNSVLWHTPP